MQIKRILVPIDGSELTERAIETSVVLSGQLGAAIVGFAANVTTSFLPETLQTRDEATWGEFGDNADISAARPVLARFAALASAAGVPFEAVLELAPCVDKAIIAAAESHRCDMIVMMTHGRGVFGEFLFGSQTKAVLAASKLPLLVLH